jgi:hypothetical protein
VCVCACECVYVCAFVCGFVNMCVGVCRHKNAFLNSTELFTAVKSFTVETAGGMRKLSLNDSICFNF